MVKLEKVDLSFGIGNLCVKLSKPDPYFLPQAFVINNQSRHVGSVFAQMALEPYMLVIFWYVF